MASRGSMTGRLYGLILLVILPPSTCLSVEDGLDVVLWERSSVPPPTEPGGRWVRCVEDRVQPERSAYPLAAVSVPASGWQVRRLGGYFEGPSPDEATWLKVGEARLNVVRRRPGDRVPPADFDPRSGRLVRLTVRKEGDIYLAVADDLAVHLEGGEYWIGLTPVRTEKGGEAGQLFTSGHRGERFEPVIRYPDFDGSPREQYLKSWQTLQIATGVDYDENLTFRVDGTRLFRGEERAAPDRPGEVTQLHLRFATFDPRARLPEIPIDLAAAPGSDLWLVQLEGTPRQSHRDTLEHAGVKLLRYIPDNAYLIRGGNPGTTSRLPGVRWVGPYHPAYRLESALLMPTPPVLGGAHIPPSYVLEAFDPSDKPGLALKISGLGGEVLANHAEGYHLVARLTLDLLRQVARMKDICSIEPADEGPGQGQQIGFGTAFGHGPPQITMSEIRALGGADFVETAGGYRGQGVNCAVIDGKLREDHVDFAGRRILFTNPTPPNSRQAYHGTPVLGILLGAGRGDRRARGLLPEGSPVYTPMDLDRLSAPDPTVLLDRYALTRKLLGPPFEVALQSDSTGGRTFVHHYDWRAEQLDDLVWKYDLLLCRAIGNAGPGEASSGSWSKNPVIVGGVDPGGSIHRDDHKPLSRGTSGPAPDGRVKPDLVHFGYGVYCTGAQSDEGYMTFAGTSCATPIAAGHLGLIVQMWADAALGDFPSGRTVFERRPHAATAKALAVNSAKPYEFVGPGAEFGRFRQGWGLPDLRSLYRLREKLFVLDADTPLGEGREAIYSLRVGPDEPALRVTLGWTDPPSTPVVSKALVDDLDLTVESPDGQVFRGNHGLSDGIWSRPWGDPDRINTLENVFISKPIEGIWKFTVTASRIAIDQHLLTPGPDCTYALVISGASKP